MVPTQLSNQSTRRDSVFDVLAYTTRSRQNGCDLYDGSAAVRCNRGAVSGWLLSEMQVFGGLHGCQWLYLIEGLPSVIVGLVALILLQDGPATAAWLRPEEKQWLLRQLREEESRRLEKKRLRTLLDAFSSKEVWILCIAFSGFAMGSYGVGFWLPQIIHDAITTDPWHIGLLSAIPWSAGALAMVLAGYHSDRTGERRWHIAIAGLIGGAAFAVSAIPGIAGACSLAALTAATARKMVTISLFTSDCHSLMRRGGSWNRGSILSEILQGTSARFSLAKFMIGHTA